MRDGITPRRAQSSTVDVGTRSSSATSRAVSTSAAVSGRPSGGFAAAEPEDPAGEMGKLVCLGLSCLAMKQN